MMRMTPGLFLGALLLAGCGDGGPRATDEDAQAPISPGARDTNGDGLIDVPGSPSPLDPPRSGADAPEPTGDPVISEPFRGRWVGALPQCRRGPATGRIVIGASEIRFARSVGDPLSVLQAGERTILVTLRIVHNGVRGERTDRLTIDPDGTSLRYTVGNESLVYLRCPT